MVHWSIRMVIFLATVGSTDLSDIALDDISFSRGCILSDKQLPGAPTAAPVNPCQPSFQCKANKKCIPRNQLCDFEMDCPDGTDECNITCGYPQGFEHGFGLWKNLLQGEYEFTVHRGALKGGPFADARGDKNGLYMLLEITKQQIYGKAIVRSPVYRNAYSNCILKFSYYMYGKDVGKFQIILNSNQSEPTTLFHLQGDQGHGWVNAEVSIGRKRHPFHLELIGYINGINEGGIAIDEINFVNCSLPPKCDGQIGGKFRCRNNLCIDKTKICDLVDDCGDLSDEDPAECSKYIGCNFEQFDVRICNFTQDKTDNFDWSIKSGGTSSVNTGPTHDHTYRTPSGHYMYIEASNRTKVEKARLFTSPINAKEHGTCKLVFYYHMKGRMMGELNIYTKKLHNNQTQLQMNLSRDQGFMWKKAVVELYDQYEKFSVIFEGVIGDSFESDIAIDDVIFSPDCLTTGRRIFPFIRPCGPNEISCKRNGNCIPSKFKCNGEKNCKDGSDEYGCSVRRKKQKGIPSSFLAGGIVGGLVFIAIVTLVSYILYKKRRSGDIHLFSVYNNKESTVPVGRDSNPIEIKVISISTDIKSVSNPAFEGELTGEFSLGELDTDIFNDRFQIDHFSTPIRSNSTTSVVNPLYQGQHVWNC